MAGNPRVHHVEFVNKTTTMVTFILESGSSPQSAFTLPPNGSHDEEVPIPVTHEQLRLVVGKDSNGMWTNECVSTDELPGLVKVEVTEENSGNDPVNKFRLVKHARKTKERRSSTSSSRSRSRSRNEGETSGIQSV